MIPSLQTVLLLSIGLIIWNWIYPTDSQVHICIYCIWMLWCIGFQKQHYSLSQSMGIDYTFITRLIWWLFHIYYHCLILWQWPSTKCLKAAPSIDKDFALKAQHNSHTHVIIIHCFYKKLADWGFPSPASLSYLVPSLPQLFQFPSPPIFNFYKLSGISFAWCKALN